MSGFYFSPDALNILHNIMLVVITDLFSPCSVHVRNECQWQEIWRISLHKKFAVHRTQNRAQSFQYIDRRRFSDSAVVINNFLLDHRLQGFSAAEYKLMSKTHPTFIIPITVVCWARRTAKNTLQVLYFLNR